MIYNELPFNDDTEYGIIEKIHKQEVRLLEDKRNISNGLKDLLLSMLTKDEEKRASIDDLRANKWINEGF